MFFKLFFSKNKFIHNLYIFSFIFFLFCTKIFSDVVWQLPAEQRAASGIDSQNQTIVTDDSGANVAIIWLVPNLAVQVAISNDFGVTWSSPINLSGANLPQTPDIAMAKTGQYIYGIWSRRPALVNQIEFSRSIDFGVNWTAVGSVQVLSDTSTGADTPSITTSSSGEFVYASWTQTIGADEIIKTSRSIDFGASWTLPASTISLSPTGQDAGQSQITTSCSGKYVYAAWLITDAITSKLRVQTSRSIDYGASWTAPGSVITLSADDQNASALKITTNIEGNDVYLVWQKEVDASNSNIQFARSTDYGATFFSTINIVSSIGKAAKPDIAIDNTGQYVYIVYEVTNLGIIQFVRSKDYGATFSSPVTISTGSSNKDPKITTDNTGKNVYIIWADNSVTFSKVAASSSDFGQSFSSPQLLTGSSDSFLQPSITTDGSGRYVYASFDIFNGADVIIHSLRALDQLLLTTPIIRVFRK